MKKILVVGVTVMLAFTVFTFTSCDWMFEQVASVLAAPQGYVYDARTGDPIDGATVTLTGATNKTATTSSTGYYTFSDVDYGTFELTATSTGYVFTKQMIEISGLAQYLPNVAGLATDFDSDGTIDLVTGVLTAVVFWDRDFQDVDAHLTFPTANVGTAIFSTNDFYNSSSNVTAGFFPIDSLTNRTLLNYGADIYPVDSTKDSNTTTGGDIWLDVDNVGYSTQPEGGPETFTIFYAPNVLSTYGSDIYTSGTDDPSKLPAGNYSWIGVMEYYLDAWNATTEPTSTVAATAESGAMLSSSDNSGAANPVVYVFDGTTQIARYTLPQYTDIYRASIFRINIFTQESTNNIYYQILPDTRVLADDFAAYANIRSLQTEAGPIVVKARTRK